MAFLESLGGYINTDISLATPILLAGLGLLIINRAGLLNIGAEGTMLIATIMAVYGSYISGSVWVGLIFAMLSGAVVGALFALLTVTLRANQTVVGAAVNVLGSGLSATLFRHVITVDGVRRIDFGTGNDAYKRDWMNRHEPLWRLEGFNRGRIAAWGPALKAFARSLLRKDP